MSGVAEVDRDRLRQRREDARHEIEAQERQRADAEELRQTAAEETAAAPECWICYSGNSEGELISPCKCRGSMQWVHRDCLHRWITTRVTEYRHDERGRDTDSRFACPNCETPFKFVDSVDDEQALGNGDEIWPSSGRWWLPNLYLRINRMAEIDADLYDNFRWKFASPLACTCVQAMLVGFTMAQLALLALTAQIDGLGRELELRDVTHKGLQASPMLTKALVFLFGDQVVAEPIVGNESIGTITDRWSQTFASIQHAHAMLMMISFSLFIWGCHDWLIPDDLAPLPVNIRRLLFRVDACFFLMTVNPPLLRCVRVLTINVLVPTAAGIYPPAQKWLLWAVYSLFTSHVDIAFHTSTAVLSLIIHVRAARREYSELAEQMETIWRVHKTGLRVAGVRVAGDVASAMDLTPTAAPEEPVSADTVAAENEMPPREAE